MKQVTVRAFRGMNKIEITKKDLIYGEITSEGREELCNFIKKHIKPTDRFIDVGSGYGKVVVKIAEKFNITSFGIEIDKKKHSLAINTTWSNKKDLINFINDDITLKLEILKHFNIMFTNNLTWSKDLVDVVFKNFKGIIYSMKIPKYIDKNSVETHEISVSWLKNRKCKIYKTNTITNR